MEWLVTAWRLLLLAGTFVFPQLIGILLYYRLSLAPRWVAAIAAALAPAVVFFWLVRLFFIAGLGEQESGCGMPGIFAGFVLLAGTAIHLVVGVIAQAVLAKRRRHTITS